MNRAEEAQHIQVLLETLPEDSARRLLDRIVTRTWREQMHDFPDYKKFLSPDTRRAYEARGIDPAWPREEIGIAIAKCRNAEKKARWQLGADICRLCWQFDFSPRSRAKLASNLAHHLLRVYANVGVAIKKSQRSKAKKPRTVPALDAVIQSLAQQPDDAKRLWRRLYDKLDADGATPREIDNADPRKGRIEYTDDSGKARHITFGTFQNKLTRIRKSQ